MESTNERRRLSWRGIGEGIGVIGVVLSLVFVGTEIRQNTLASRAQARQELAAQNWDFLLRLAEDDELAELWSREWTTEFLDGLSPESAFKASLSAIALLTRLEGVYLQTAEGLLDEEALSGYGMIQPRFEDPGFRALWGRVRDTFNPRFRDYFEELHGYSP